MKPSSFENSDFSSEQNNNRNPRKDKEKFLSDLKEGTNDSHGEYIKGYTDDKFSKLAYISRRTSHQLNNMLTTILANVQLILLIGKNEEAEPLLKVIEDSAMSAGALVLEFQESVREVLGGQSNGNQQEK